MANRKDMRRADLALPYVDPPKNENTTDFAGSMSSTLPMAAMFTRNRYISWTSVIFAVQSWMSETPASKANSSTPGYFSVLMALMSIAVAYLPYFMPPPPVRAGGPTGTGAPPAMPQ